LEPDKRIAAELPPKQTYREFVQTYEESERREKEAKVPRQNTNIQDD
jgi:hypothetical protein